MAYILVIEDTRDNREIAEIILRDAGHTVVSATDGMSGVAAAASARPDLILMDLSLPQLDGWEATRRLKSDPATRDIPVIAFTAHVTRAETEAARAAGCDAVIAKPFDIDTFLRAVRTALAAQPAERSLGA